MVLIILDDVSLQTDLVLGVLLDEATIFVFWQERKSVVVHGVYSRRAFTTINHADFAEMATLHQLTHDNLLAMRVANGDFAVTFSHIIERAIIFRAL